MRAELISELQLAHLSKDTLDSKDSAVELNKLCALCQQICKDSQVLNSEAWHRAATVPDTILPGAARDRFSLGTHSQSPRHNGRITWDEGYFPESFSFHHSVDDLRSSAREGCHLCTLLCYNTERWVRSQHSMYQWKSMGLWQYVEQCLRSKPFRLGLAWECDYSGEDVHYRFTLQEDSLDIYSNSEFCRVYLVSNVASDNQAHLIKTQTTEDRGWEISLTGSKHNGESRPRNALSSVYTGSRASFALAQSWMQQCQRDHISCSGSRKDPTFVPSRLIDIGPENGPGFPKLYICDEKKDHMDYLTLSHCWGKKSVYTLTTKSLKEMQQRIPLENLPLNFQEALKVCRGLNQRYIWIDSLCILQDSVSDWEKESAMMASIYSNSWCNIAAVCASDSSEGFLRLRNPRCVLPCTLPVKLDLTATAEHPYNHHFIDQPARPLHSRAWVLQERLLSPRSLQFHQTFITWQCRACVASEHDRVLRARPNEPPLKDSEEDNEAKLQEALKDLRSITALGDSNNHNKFFECWRRIILTYTGLSLTVLSDRLPAFSGILQAHLQRTGMMHFEGLWLSCFLPMLLWYSRGPSGRRYAENVQNQGSDVLYTSRTRTNTLSWASIEGEVDYYHDWPFKTEGANFQPDLDQQATKESGFGVDRAHSVVIRHANREVKDNGSLGTRMRAGASSADYCYRARVVEIRPSSQMNGPSKVTLEGPVWHFETKNSSNLSWDAKWSHPFPIETLDYDSWFFPDTEILKRCPSGAYLDVTCLAIIEWRQGPQPIEWDEYGIGRTVVTGAWVAGIVVVKNQSQSDTAAASVSYSRIGFFRFSFKENIGFEPVRKISNIEQISVI